MEAVLQLPSPRTIKEVQSFNGKLASLNRFISKLAERSLPLFKTLKKCTKKSDFPWTPDAEHAFKQLKQHLARLPMLGHSLDIGLFCEPSAAGSRAKLYPNRKASPGAGLRSQKVAQILPDYEALIAGLWIAAQMGVRNVHVSVDSKLVANQVLGTYVTKEENMVKYLEKAKSLISGFANFSISQILRSKTKKADAPSKIALTSFAHLLKQFLVEVLKGKSIQEEEVAIVVEEEGPTWMTPIMEYLKDGTLPGDRNEASKLCIKARQYELLEGVLYRRSFLKSRSFPEEPGNVKFFIVVVDYFTKWIEVKVVATITVIQVKKFMWDNIVCCYGLPGEIVSNNEIRMPTYHTAVVNVVYNNEELRLNLDLLEEQRECAAIREAKAKLKMTKYYNTRVRGVTFRHEDFFTVIMRQVMLWMEESSARSGKDPMGSPKPSETEHTG
nr:reverse transcriptase domain-containing protein [Tanacetum cinerariifolium]GEY80795.1 reverse transcriptase domain-containing protein [Tanacetum cinerariifolium]